MLNEVRLEMFYLISEIKMFNEVTSLQSHIALYFIA